VNGSCSIRSALLERAVQKSSALLKRTFEQLFYSVQLNL
jgi:hypothetical protein